jgi:predicted Ser/Thr protein kinase
MIPKFIESKTERSPERESIQKALQHLNQKMGEVDTTPVSFQDFLQIILARPQRVIRDVFQLFYDMIKTYVGGGIDEYPDDPESINYVYYECNRLFVEGSDSPFFADRLFANRLISLVESLKRGAQQNKVYIFEGPPGSGKSTFLNNLLRKFEEYTATEEGVCYETVWHIDPVLLGNHPERGPVILEKVYPLPEETDGYRDEALSQEIPGTEEYVEVPCPSHDHPILMIPKAYRRAFFDDLFKNDEFKWRLSTEKEYDWVFKDNPCTICTSIYQALLSRVRSPLKIFQMLHVRPYRFNRRLGDGISVFSPGDKPSKQGILTNSMLQNRINTALKDSNQVKYIYSRYAKTNNGIYALMDIKGHNAERLMDLHNIISEGVHKVEDIEENVTSLFLALMNPEDKANIQEFQSFTDRIEYITIPYVLDLNTEVEIYRNIFGRHIDSNFLPRVLHNFARVIISSRLNLRSEALLEWIGDPGKYRLYCDENLLLLKMEIYTGYIPNWLSEEDRKRFTAKRRKKIIAESEKEGDHGFSGRDSIKIFNEFYSAYAKDNKLINMSTLINYFTRFRRELSQSLPLGFLDSLVRMYNYTVLQEVKESLYYYNEEQISRDIQNYIFAVNFEPGAVVTSKFTGDKVEITEEFFESMERRLLGTTSFKGQRTSFRNDIQNEYTSRTLTQEILLQRKPVTQTQLYQSLHERYVHNLKEKALDPFLENENFRRAVKDFGEEDFKTYDKRIRDDVTFLMNNLTQKHRYTRQGAKEVCMYVIDNDLAGKFGNS